MKHIRYSFFLIISLTLISLSTEAQFLKVLQRQVEYQLRNRASQRVSQAVDKGLNEVEGAATGKNTKNRKKNKKEKQNAANNADGTSSGSAKAENSIVSSASTFDFVEGETTVLTQDFGHLKQGDFPSDWRSTGSAEVVKIKGKPGNWLSINTGGTYMPAISNVPGNFTFEFDLACSGDLTDTRGFEVDILNLANRSKFHDWEQGTGNDAIGKGIKLTLRPGASSYAIQLGHERSWKNERQTKEFMSGDKINQVHISISKQNERLRLYMNHQKIWDLPQGFAETGPVNAILFKSSDPKNAKDVFFLTNIKVATGDTITEINH